MYSEEGSDLCNLAKNEVSEICCVATGGQSKPGSGNAPEADPCGMCANGVTVDADVTIPDFGDCQGAIEQASFLAADSEMCFQMKIYEILCCPVLATDPCWICPDGDHIHGGANVLGDDDEVSNLELTCSDVSMYSEEGSDLCNLAKNEVSEICCVAAGAPSQPDPTSVPPTSSLDLRPQLTSNSTSSSSLPTSLPSAPPSRAGNLHGPNVTERIVMTIRGIESLGEEVWSAGTAEYVMEYFNGNKDAFAWDVEASIEVADVKTSEPAPTAGSEIFKRRGKRRLGPLQSGPENGRELQQRAKFVQITYSQRSTYKTADADAYDAQYVATQPFVTRQGVEGYIEWLRAMDPHYADITSVGSVRVNPPTPTPAVVAEPEEEEDDGGNGKTILYAVIGSLCGAVVIIAAMVLVAYQRKRARSGAQYMEPVGNGPASSMRQFGDDNGAGGGDLESSSSSGSSSSGSYASANLMLSSSASNAPSPPSGRCSLLKNRSSRNNSGEELAANPTDSTSSNSTAAPDPSLAEVIDVVIVIVAPPGKLGVIVDTPPEGGCAYVCEIKDSCPVIDQIRLEDRIIAVDDEDVQMMTAVNVSKMLARRSRNEERKITVLRALDGPPGTSGGGNGNGAGDIALADGLLGSMQNDDLQMAHTLMAVGAAAPASPTAENAVEEEEVNPNAEEDEEWLDIIAPAGKLGVVLVTPEPPDFGPAYVFKMRDESPLKDDIKLGDKIVAVDGEDVRSMSAINVSKLLGSKSGNVTRKISVLREQVKNGDDDGGGKLPADVSDSSSTRSGSDRSSSVGAESSDEDEKVAEIAPATAAIGGDGDRSSSAGTEPSDEDENVATIASATAAIATTDTKSSDEDENVAAIASATAATEDDGYANEIKLDIVAPAGKLGVVVDSPPNGGSAYVSEVKDFSPVKGEIHLGDRIIAVDGEDVSKLKAIHVSMLLGSKSRNVERNITILRDG